jgi:hypothetical protein
MRSWGFRIALIGLIAMVGASVSSMAHADSGAIRISVFKGGWFLGASGGNGTLTFHGRQYPLSIGGIDFGLVFGASHTYLYGLPMSLGSTARPAPAQRSLPGRGRSC